MSKINFINEDFNKWKEAFLNFNNLNKDFLINDYEVDYEIDKLKDVDKGADLVIEHINNNKRILLVTDYDCDGISSAIVLTKFFRDNLQYENFSTLLNRRKQGNGFNKTLMSKIMELNEENQIDLIITADHGSSDDEAFGILKLNNIKVIVTDHHEIPLPLKNPDVFINPMRNDSEYYKHISGCHTAFLLCVSIWKKLNNDLKGLDNLLPYVAISTVVDQMPMTNKHNRNCVKTGLNYINKNADKSFEVFKTKAKIGYVIRSKDIGFKIGPFFNSGNRTNIEDKIFEAFTLEDLNAIEDRMNFGLLNNQRRKDEQKKSMFEIRQHLEQTYPNLDNVFAVALELNSTFGIAGPIASTIGSDINRPTIVFKESFDPEIISGSGRAIIEHDVLQTLKRLEKDRPDMILKLGGHSKAFGIEIKASLLPEFRVLFSDYIKQDIGSIPETTFNVIAKVKPLDIGLDLFLETEEFGPYGNNYQEPLFYSELEYVRSYDVGSGLSIVFKRSNKSEINGLYFFGGNGISKKTFTENIKSEMKCGVVYSLNLNSYYTTSRMRYDISLDIKDIKLLN